MADGRLHREKSMEEWLERYRGVLFVILIALALGGVVILQIVRPAPAPAVLIVPTPSPLPRASATPRPLRVYISGAVQKPDVYALAPDSIVKDVLLAAGGAAEDADLDRINLAMPLADGQQIYVPRVGEESLPVAPAAGGSAAGGKVNINTAGLEELETLPGIGPGIAQRIVDYRQANGPFAQVADIKNVSGIGPATFEKIEGLITTQ
jgi:competence protein ComEA